MTKAKGAIERTKNLMEHIRVDDAFTYSQYGRDRFTVLQTMLVVNAIDRLAHAVTENTAAIRQVGVPLIGEDGAEIPIVRTE